MSLSWVLLQVTKLYLSEYIHDFSFQLQNLIGGNLIFLYTLMVLKKSIK